LISLRREIEAAEHFVPRFRALLKAFLGLTVVVPKAALPASPELSEECKADLDRVTAPLTADEPTTREIEEAGESAIGHLEAICAANRSALEERDAALKEVVATAAEAIGSFKGHGERHNSNLTKLAEGFDSLSHIDDVNELRRRLRENASKLRECAEEMRRENAEALQRFETQVTTFQQRLEAARKDSTLDRLTGLGSRREAERFLQKIPQQGEEVSVLLFSIEKFEEITERSGPLFRDKLLRAFAHLLLEQYSDDHAYRWSAHEFVVVSAAKLATSAERGRQICGTFATSKYYSAEAGPGVPLRAIVALGAAQWTRGESADALLRRVVGCLERDRKTLWK
jgi:GGDEF domain-containing protein